MSELFFLEIAVNIKGETNLGKKKKDTHVPHFFTSRYSRTTGSLYY